LASAGSVNLTGAPGGSVLDTFHPTGHVLWDTNSTCSCNAASCRNLAATLASPGLSVAASAARSVSTEFFTDGLILDLIASWKVDIIYFT
jgi:hypothetical protein